MHVETYTGEVEFEMGEEAFLVQFSHEVEMTYGEYGSEPTGKETFEAVVVERYDSVTEDWVQAPYLPIGFQKALEEAVLSKYEGDAERADEARWERRYGY